MPTFRPATKARLWFAWCPSRGKKLTIQEAVSFVKQLVGDDPLRRTEPWAFVRRWLSLRHEPAWSQAVASA